MINPADNPPVQHRLVYATGIGLLLLGIACSRSTPPPAPDATAQQAMQRQALPSEPPAINGGLSITAPNDTTPQPAVVQASVAEEQARFVLQPGYHLEPVLTEPHIREPAAIAFDGNGRMFVLELRSYMQDADATGELLPTSQISMHEDTDNDGTYDRHTVFVDSLVFARFVMPLGANSILTMESNEDDVFRFTDTDGDGIADEKELFTTNFGRAGNVEHQQAFLTWAMDNWLYSTYNAFRVRWTPDAILREETGANRAQWGVTQDNDGKVWFQGGASGLPSYFQFPVVYGNYDVDDQFEEGFEVPYGLAGLGDYQPGPEASRPDGTLSRVTGSAGNDVFRGHRLPDDLVGDYLYGEPVARIVRRVRPVVTEGLTQLQNVYQDQQSEFIRSTDPLFRPVDIATAPDGSVYIVDMYRGIIQEGNWTRRGSYLRSKIEQYSLDEAIGHGRIWRLTYDGMERDRQQPRMLDETPAQRVRHLEHPNGWWRDTAQQLLILQQDRSVVPALENIARTSDNLLGRFHALWTLEGLGALDASLARELMADSAPRMRIQAIRASETLYKSGDTSFADDYRKLALDSNADIAVQALMTLNTLDVPDVESEVRAAQAANRARGVQEVGNQILEAAEDPGFRGPPEYVAMMERGSSIYNELCVQCHGKRGTGTPVGEGRTMAPALANSPRVQGHPDYVIQVLLHGLTGPIEGTSYPEGVMVAMGANPDAWVAAVASFVRNSFANEGSTVTPEQVAEARAATAGRNTSWTYDELMAMIPQPLRTQSTWRADASHNAPAAPGALNFAGWSSEAPQQPGMWFQVELAEPALVTELQFDSPFQRRGWGRDAPPPVSTAPREYEVQVSLDGTTWSLPVAEGEGDGSDTVITFTPVQAKFIRITQTATFEEAPPWSIRELRIFYATAPDGD